jgi:hypothetical protein
MHKFYALCVLLIFSFFYSHLSAQNNFRKVYGGLYGVYGSDVIQTSDQKYVACGWVFYNGSGAGKIVLLKVNSLGDTIWSKFVELGASQFSFSLAEASNGDLLVTGYLTGSQKQIVLLRADSTGNILWTKKFGSTLPSENLRGCVIRRTYDNGFIVLSFMENFIRYQPYLIKLDQNGDTLWTMRYTLNAEYLPYFSIYQTLDSGYIFAGCFYEPAGLPNQNFIIKVDKVGNLEWSRNYKSTDSMRVFHITDCIQLLDSNYFIVGGYQSSMMAWLTLVKLDSNGNMIFEKSYEDTWHFSEPSVCLSNDNCIIIGDKNWNIAQTHHNFSFTKIDTSGIVQWYSVLETGYDNLSCYPYIKSVKRTADGGFVATGFACLPDDRYRLAIVKIDSAGFNDCNQSYKMLLDTTPDLSVASLPLTNSPYGISIVNANGLTTSMDSVFDLCQIIAKDRDPLFQTGVHVWFYQNTLKLEGDLNDYQFLNIFDFSGRLIFHRKLIGQSGFLLPLITNGLYIYSLNGIKVPVLSGKVLKLD